MKHTPGPWQYQPSMPEEGVNCWWIFSQHVEMGVIGSVDGPQSKTTEADAMLIAAAPDLLEALKDALAAAECSSILASDYVMDRMRSAIDLATKGKR